MHLGYRCSFGLAFLLSGLVFNADERRLSEREQSLQKGPNEIERPLQQMRSER